MKSRSKRIPCVVAILAGVSAFSTVCMAGDEGLLFRFDANMPGSIVDGKTVKDQSPNGNDGQIHGDLRLADEEGGKAFFFDGTSAYIKMPSLSRWNLKGSVTFSAVVKFLDDGNVEGRADSHDMLISKDNQFYLGCRNSGPFTKRNLYFGAWNGKAFSPEKYFHVTPKETWLQLDARFTLLNRETGSYRAEFFVNGEKVTEGRFNSMFPQASDNPIHIGHGFTHEGSTIWLLHGSIASISMYDRALADNEIVRSAMDNPYLKKKPEKQLRASVSFLPAKGTGSLAINGASLGDMTGATGSYELKHISADGAAEVVSKGTLREFTDDLAQVEFELAPLKAGKYQFDITTVLRDGQTAVANVVWEKPDVQLWRDAKAGASDEVIPPWTPLVKERQGDKLVISCWGRTYEFSGNGLASVIVSRDEQILSEPIELTATVDGKPVQWKYDEPKVTSATPAKITFSGGASGSGLRLEVEATIEFDGLVVSHFTLKAEPKHQGWFERLLGLVKGASKTEPIVKVGRTALRIPLRAATSKYVSILNYSKYVQNSSFRGGVNQLPDNLYFPYYLWMGDEDLGFAWFSERRLANRLADPSKAVELQRGGEAVVQTVNLLDQETSLEQPLTFTVGFQATPMKPMPKNYRTYFNDRVELIWTSPKHNKYYGYPEAVDLEFFRSEVKKVHDNGKVCMHLFGIPMLSGASPEFQYFGKDWAGDSVMDDVSLDIIQFKPPAPYYSLCPVGKDMIDFVSYKTQKLIQDTGIDGVYIDYTWGTNFCRNTNHGCPEEGGYPILAMRDLYRRVYTVFKSQPKETFVEGHVSWGLPIAPVASFLDAMDLGEEASVLNAKGNYYNPGAFFTPAITPPSNFDSFMAGYLGQQFGTIPIFWRHPETDPKFQGLEMERRLVTVMLLNDVLAYQGWFFTDAAPRMMGIMKAFGVDEATFIPYWGKDQPVTLVSVEPQPAKFGLSAPVLVSVYNHTGKKALIVVGNTSDTALKATVKIDAKALGFPGTTTVRDAYAPAGDLSQGGSVTVDIPALESRLLLVE